jgi:bacterioferritin
MMKYVDRAALIAGLNEDLAYEYASLIQYRTFASTIRGPHRLTLRPLFAREIADELGHAELLADAIVVLGGTPTVTPAPVPVAEGSGAMLRRVLKAEGGALARYVERRRQAETLGEYGLAVALDEIIADETRHRDELRLVLAGWADAAADDGMAAGDVRRQPGSTARDRSAGAPAVARQRARRDVAVVGARGAADTA